MGRAALHPHSLHPDSLRPHRAALHPEMGCVGVICTWGPWKPDLLPATVLVGAEPAELATFCAGSAHIQLQSSGCCSEWRSHAVMFPFQS